MNKNDILHCFNPVIYPQMVWIAVTTKSDLKGFSGLSKFGDDFEACTETIHDDIHNLGGICIRFANKECMTTRNITHESIHAALDIFGYIDSNINIEDQEPFCYLAGWIAECCEKVKESL